MQNKMQNKKTKEILLKNWRYDLCRCGNVKVKRSKRCWQCYAKKPARSSCGWWRK